VFERFRPLRRPENRFVECFLDLRRKFLDLQPAEDPGRDLADPFQRIAEIIRGSLGSLHPLGQLFDRGLRLVEPRLQPIVGRGYLDINLIISHRFSPLALSTRAALVLG